ncbi:MAG TPA: DUF3592 domain-containing protein [Thermoanaerobaculia bacterium]|nr:DUF3592 domain-containing protein [Thermoanaerobaculia bacterium]
MTSGDGFSMHLPPAPRRLPLSLQISNLFDGLTQIGFFILLFSTPFMWGFVGNADFSPITFHGAIQKTEGHVTKVENTRASEGHQNIYANHYSFFADGRHFEGVSYSLGAPPEVSSKIAIEFDRNNPKKSRIEGMRRGQFGLGVLFVLIFPAVGLLITVFSMRASMRTLAILSRGVMTYGTFKEKRATNVTVNRQRLYQHIFDFTAADGKTYEASATAGRSAEELTDDDREALLYDPAAPEKAVLIDNLSIKPEVDSSGALKGNTGQAIRRLILPAITVGVNVLWLLHVMKQ